MADNLTPEHLRYMLAVIAEQEGPLTEMFTKASVADLVIIFAYVLAALDTQIPGSISTFGETYNIFRVGYPDLLEQYKKMAGDDDVEGFKFIVPHVGEKPKVNPFLEDSPRVEDSLLKLPGTGSIN